MNTNPLTEELYSIDWSNRFDIYDKANSSIYTDLDNILIKIEGIIAKTLDVGSLQSLESLKKCLAKTKVDTPEWQAITMLIDLRTLTAAKSKHLDHTATLCAMQIMGNLCQPANYESKPKSSSAPKKKAAAKTNTAKKTVKAPKPKLQSVPKAATSASQNDSQEINLAKSDPMATSNVVINNLAQHTKMMESDTPPDSTNDIAEKEASDAGESQISKDETPLSIQCAEVADLLAEEFPKYTLTAIRVMTAEKLGVTRQYLENLDIKPKRFQT